MVTVEGRLTSPLLELSDIVVPPSGAFPLRVTLPVAEAPPATDPGVEEML